MACLLLLTQPIKLISLMLLLFVCHDNVTVNNMAVFSFAGRSVVTSAMRDRSLLDESQEGFDSNVAVFDNYMCIFPPG